MGLVMILLNDTSHLGVYIYKDNLMGQQS